MTIVVLSAMSSFRGRTLIAALIVSLGSFSRDWSSVGIDLVSALMSGFMVSAHSGGMSVVSETWEVVLFFNVDFCVTFRDGRLTDRDGRETD